MEKNTLPRPVSITVRVDGSPVGVIQTDRIGSDAVQLPVAKLPLTTHSFIELELNDNGRQLIVPAIVTEVGEHELTAVYEQTDDAFIKWRQGQFDGVAN